jgi:hypothetical protein
MWLLSLLFVASIVASFGLLVGSVVEYAVGDHLRGRSMLWAGAISGAVMVALSAAGAGGGVP